MISLVLILILFLYNTFIFVYLHVFKYYFVTCHISFPSGWHYWLLLKKILVIWKARSRTQPICSSVRFPCLLASPSIYYHIYQSTLLPILGWNRSSRVFSNLKGLFRLSILRFFMLFQLCLAFYFLYSGAHFAKPKLAEKYKWILTGIRLSDGPVRDATTWERDEE